MNLTSVQDADDLVSDNLEASKSHKKLNNDFASICWLSLSTKFFFLKVSDNVCYLVDRTANDNGSVPTSKPIFDGSMNVHFANPSLPQSSRASWLLYGLV